MGYGFSLTKTHHEAGKINDRYVKAHELRIEADGIYDMSLVVGIQRFVDGVAWWWPAEDVKAAAGGWWLLLLSSPAAAAHRPRRIAY